MYRSVLTMKDNKTPLHEHNLERHDDRVPDLKMTIKDISSDATMRQVRESVIIQ